MMRFSSACACSYSSRAAAPYSGMLEDRREAPLQLPRREEERPVDELRDVRERHVVQVAAADEPGRRDDVVVPVGLQPVRARLLVGQQRLLAPRRVLLADLRLRRAIGRVERRRARRRAGSTTTSTARDASSTWTTGPLYSGAIFTAVCCLLVVAPPISSGIVKPRRSISRATNTISSSDGVMRPLRPIDVAPSARSRRRESSPPAP